MNIFQIYHDKKYVPDEVKNNIIDMHPGCNYRLLNFKEGKELVQTTMEPELASKVCYSIDNLVRYCHKSDLLRYCLLYMFGGYYLDVDLYLTKPFNTIAPPEADLFTSFGLGKPLIANGILIHEAMANGIMGAKKGNPILLDLINFCIKNTRLFDSNPMNRGDNVYHLYNYLQEQCAKSTPKTLLEPFKLMYLKRPVYLINTRQYTSDGTNCLVDCDGKIVVNPNKYRIPRQSSGPI
jgi:hypothetical protein